MRKFVFLTAVATVFLGIFGEISSAEQVSAEKYRQIFQSDEFYVEYKDNYATRIIAQKNGARMERMNYGGIGFSFGSIFGGGGSYKYPEVMYKDGNYYQFTAKDKAMVCHKDRLIDENLDPKQGWNGIWQKLALPMELAVLYWNDPFRDSEYAMEAPEPTWSGKKTVGKVEYDCDRYASRIYSASTGDSYYVYELLYENGDLKKIQSYVKHGETEHPVNMLEIKKIGGTWPADLFRTAEEVKIYAPGTGDMNDLLEQPVEVGKMGAI